GVHSQLLAGAGHEEARGDQGQQLHRAERDAEQQRHRGERGEGQDRQQQHHAQRGDQQRLDRQALDEIPDEIRARGRMVVAGVVVGVVTVRSGRGGGVGHGAPSGSRPAYRGRTGRWLSAGVWNDGVVRTDVMNTSGEGLSPLQRQRAAGAVVAAAAGDALGAPYEFQPPVPDSEDIDMIGGGVLDWHPGEWTDDTAMAIVVLEASLAASDGHDLRVETAQDHISREWYSWSLGTPDIGTLTSQVVRTAADLARVDGHYAPRAKDFRIAADSAHEQLPASAGNGSLMRVHASVLPYLLSPEEDAVEAIIAVCRLTHVHPDTIEASVLWGLAVRHAIRTGEIDVRQGRPHLPEERRDLWSDRIAEAEQSTPVMFRRNGWVVGAFQAAWSAIVGVSPIPEGK